VSVNTTQELAQFNIKRTSSGSTVRALALYNNVATSVNTGVSLEFYPNGGDNDRAAIISSVQSTSGNYADLRFFTSNDAAPGERMRITSVGNVGIGTSSPTEKLDVNGSIRAVDLLLADLGVVVKQGTTASYPANYSGFAASSLTNSINWVNGTTGKAFWFIFPSGITASQLTIPNNSGTIALTSDIPILAPIQSPVFAGFSLLGSAIKYSILGNPNFVVAASANLLNQIRYIFPIYIAKTDTITGVKFYAQITGNFTGNNFNGLALYSYDGAGNLTQVAITANDANIWKGTAQTWQQVNFISSVTLNAGVYFIAAMYCSSSQVVAPAVGSGTNLPVNIVGYDFTNNCKLSAQLGLQTTMPATDTTSSYVNYTAQQAYFLY
jgi:hypothetical protein